MRPFHLQYSECERRVGDCDVRSSGSYGRTVCLVAGIRQGSGMAVGKQRKRVTTVRNCGRGKSLLVRYAIPMLLRKFANRIVTVVDCGSQSVNIDDVIKRKFITLDDMGVEVDRVEFGTRRNLVVELINKAQDKPDTLLFISSNLTGEAIKDRYGDRIYDRIKYLCHRVAFNGNSLRK